MRKNYIYLTLITLIFISCSKSTPEGDWRVSEKTFIQGMEIPDKINHYYKQEMKEKLSSELSENIVYSFQENGILKISTLSPIDTTEYALSGRWDLSDSQILSIRFEEEPFQKYQFEIDKNIMSLSNIQDTSKIYKIILNRISD